MQDELKRYVDDHRDEFEIHQPRESLWEGIIELLHQNHRGTFWKRFAIAASILLVVTSTAFIYIESRYNIANKTTVQIQPPIMGTELYFAAIVQMKDAQLEQYCMHQPELCNEFEKDMQTLNNAYYQLKKEYAIAADKKAVLQAMTANLQMQVQLISQQLQIMETVKQKKSEMNTI